MCPKKNERKKQQIRRICKKGPVSNIKPQTMQCHPDDKIQLEGFLKKLFQTWQTKYIKMINKLRAFI